MSKYERVYSIVENDSEYEYEELTLEEFIKKDDVTYEEKVEMCKSTFAVNIHYMISNQTLERAYEIMNDTKTDPRLEKLNALVLLSLKQKGRGEHFTRLSQEDFTKLVEYGMSNNIRLGFDSCGASKFLKSIENHPNYEQLEQMVEPCESGLFSTYINVEGKFFPCSFSEGTEGWEDGIDCACDDFDFLRDVWYSKRVMIWRRKLLNNCRNCPIYDV